MLAARVPPRWRASVLHQLAFGEREVTEEAPPSSGVSLERLSEDPDTD